MQHAEQGLTVPCFKCMTETTVNFSLEGSKTVVYVRIYKDLGDGKDPADAI